MTLVEPHVLAVGMPPLEHKWRKRPSVVLR